MIPLVPVMVLGGLGYLGYRAHKKTGASKSGYVSPPPVPQVPPGYAAPTASVMDTVYPTYKIAQGDIPILIASRFTVSQPDIIACNPTIKHKYTGGYATADLTPGMTINLPKTAKDNGSRNGATGVATGVSKGLTSEMDIPGFSAGINQMLRETAARGGSAEALAQAVSRIAIQIQYMSVPGDTVAGIRSRFGIPSFFSSNVNDAANGGGYTYKVGTKQMSILLPNGAVDNGPRAGATGKVLNHATGQYE